VAGSDDVFPSGDRCEICGLELRDEIVIQEFADGSLARLCPECAAGASFSAGSADQVEGEQKQSARRQEQPDANERPPAAAAPQARANAADDALDKTRELLLPVADLIALQGEMQAALGRLALSLERFAAEIITESQGKSATVESRLHSLERELETTRQQLRETEFVLASAGEPVPLEAPTGAAPGEAPGETTSTAPTQMPTPELETVVPEPDKEVPGASEDGPVEEEEVPIVWPEFEAEEKAGEGPEGQAAAEAGARDEFAEFAETLEAAEAPEVPAAEETSAPTEAPYEEPRLVPPPVAQPAVPVVAPPVPSPSDRQIEPIGHFRMDEVQAVQRYFNESSFTAKMREVGRSLGRPRVNLTPASGPEPRILVTVAWDIVWYQYLVDLRRELPLGERVILFREGMDLNELPGHLTESNASLDDDGRVDASELEVKLLSDPSTLISEMTPEEERVLEDATGEIWDQGITPEFKWDD